MKKLMAVLCLLLVCLTGCSDKYDPTGTLTVKYKNGAFYIDDYALTIVSSYKGYEALIENGQGGLSYRMYLDNAKDVTNIMVNTQGILEENMDKYKDAFYYTEYLGSSFTMAYMLQDSLYSVIQCATNGVQTSLLATYTRDYISNVKLTNGQVHVDFGDFTFGNDYDIIEVRPDCALITGVAKVSVNTYNCTEQVTVQGKKNTYTLMKGSSEKYDYYAYNEFLIQLAKGLDINNYIKFE